jgi:hypothetical protein
MSEIHSSHSKIPVHPRRNRFDTPRPAYAPEMVHCLVTPEANRLAVRPSHGCQPSFRHFWPRLCEVRALILAEGHHPASSGIIRAVNFPYGGASAGLVARKSLE